jgi:hypothetical protein
MQPCWSAARCGTRLQRPGPLPSRAPGAACRVPPPTCSVLLASMLRRDRQTLLMVSAGLQPPAHTAATGWHRRHYSRTPQSGRGRAGVAPALQNAATAGAAAQAGRAAQHPPLWPSYNMSKHMWPLLYMCGWTGVGVRNTTSGGSRGYRSVKLTLSLQQHPTAPTPTPRLSARGSGVREQRCLPAGRPSQLAAASLTGWMLGTGGGGGRRPVPPRT